MSRLRHLLPSLNALVTFEAAVRCGTFARAAQELCVTGPAVSRTIGRLEAHLGVVLFHRTASGAVLTEQGSVLFSGISGSFDEIERTVLRVQQSRQSGMRTVVLSVSSAFATHWFMPRLALFQSRFPKVDIRFQLISGPLGGAVDGVDIAMRFDHGSNARHVARKLMPELLVPIRAPHLPEKQAPTGAFMPALDRIINLSTAEPDWSGLFSENTANGTAGGLQFSDYTVVVQAALLGQGVALGWLNVVSHHLARGVLVPVGPVMKTGRTCELVIARKQETPVVSEICDWMDAEFTTDMKRVDAQYPGLEFGADPARQENVRNPIRSSSHPASCGGF
ncbi:MULTISPECIES: LysR family transcriptional regulator [unclassified Mesorhizobium]|uniref:LysR family transcriptional regulator n=1 Tax=unclassified Mesorhizobium TaxID=325217 RepID=UPI001128BBB7|nr:MULTISPECIES: LysR family transcriptional regulator [unclassified Mesorhizobium]MBZ9982419.1 LysR family transcriptional regulator [Mesorhizobium sp. BR-1-1-8]TPL32320.1 LysR family transcriptional regulator [Mesorhizobium sp. B2-4-8]TPL61100.1 LysR family transcriptional regulator [Mesorhizobium sp. B2-4-1]